MTGRALVAAVGVAVAVGGGGALAGCGSGDEGGGGSDASSAVRQAPTTAVGPATGPQATVPTTTTPAAPVATTGEPTGGGHPGGTTTGESTSTGESGAGGAGDEEPVRVPVRLVARDGALRPTVVTIPAFLAVEVRVTAEGGATDVTISAPGCGDAFHVAVGATATRRLTGLKPGDYAVTTTGGGRTTLRVVNGGDPGP